MQHLFYRHLERNFKFLSFNFRFFQYYHKIIRKVLLLFKQSCFDCLFIQFVVKESVSLKEMSCILNVKAD